MHASSVDEVHTPASSRRLLTARQTCERYGNISEKTLGRWINNPKLGFAVPTYINHRRYFDELELDAFDERSRRAGRAR